MEMDKNLRAICDFSYSQGSVDAVKSIMGVINEDYADKLIYTKDEVLIMLSLTLEVEEAGLKKCTEEIGGIFKEDDKIVIN